MNGGREEKRGKLIDKLMVGREVGVDGWMEGGRGWMDE